MITVSSNLDEVIKSLEAWHKEAVRKMEGMVHKFAYVVAATALDYTPYGDSVANEGYYKLTSRLRYLPDAKEGYAKGGWMIEMNSPNDEMFPDKANSREATNIHAKLKEDAKVYKLGETIFITNNVPYVSQKGFTLPSFGSLEGGYSAQAPNGMMGPTIGSVMRTYQLHLDDYYKKA